MQDNVEDAIQEVQDDADDLDTNKLDKTSVKTTKTTSDTDTYSCNYVNSKNLKSLWGNSNPSATFTSQTITLSSSDYDYLIFIYKMHTGSNRQKSQMVLKGADCLMDLAWDYGVGGTYYIGEYYRTTSRTNDTQYSINECYVRYNSGTTGTTNNNYIIPVAVYGGKF